MAYGDPIMAYPLISEWQITIGGTGSSGTRKYLETTETLSGTKEAVPNIGQVWDGDHPITVSSIKMTYLNDNDNCGKLYTVNYDSNSSFNQQFEVAADELPVSVDIGGELIAVEPFRTINDVKTYYWKFVSDEKDVEQPLYKRTAVASIKFTRIVSDAEAYVNTCMDYVGKVNQDTFFGFGIEQVMFEGCSTYQFLNSKGQKRWKAELTFTVRKVTGEGSEDGWNYVLRPDGLGEGAGWDKPVIKTGVNANKSLYEDADFDALLNEGVLNEDENYYPSFPAK